MGGAGANPPERPRPPDGVGRPRRNDRRGRIHRCEYANPGRGPGRAPRPGGNRRVDGGRKPRGGRRGHTRQRIGRSRSRRRIGERHRRRRADRHTRHRRRQLQGESRNRGAAAGEGVPERDVRGNGSPCDGRRTGTARNRSRRKNRAGTSTTQLSRKKLIGRSQATRQLGRGPSGIPGQAPPPARPERPGPQQPEGGRTAGRSTPQAKRPPEERHLRRTPASQWHANEN